MLSLKIRLGLYFLIITPFFFSQTLIINEVSNGPAGNQEYVEFVVVSDTAIYDCNSTSPPCIDIRGWIFDDNSGYHGTSGVAAGAVRFSQAPLWSCVPLGTIILIYNNADPNSSLPAPDLTLADGNCTIVAPINNSSLFESNATTPGAVACSYPQTGWTVGGNWNNTLLANSGDCARIVDLSGCEVFSLCWSSDNQNNLIYFSSGGSGTDNVWYFNGGNPNLQTNWSEGCTDPSTCGANNQTPGAPNNAANAAYIAQFNNGCLPIQPVILSTSSIDPVCGCDGSASVTASGSIPGYSYEWFDASMNSIGQSNSNAINLCAGTYIVSVTSSIGCTATSSITLTNTNPTTIPQFNQVAPICHGGFFSLPNSSLNGISGSWSPVPNYAQTTTYTFTPTSGSCASTVSLTVTVHDLPQPVISGVSQICPNSQAFINCSGVFVSYQWSNGSNASSTNYSTSQSPASVTVTDINGCSNQSNSIVIQEVPAIETYDTLSICQGDSILINGSYETLEGNYSQTFVTSNGCDSISYVNLIILQLPLVFAGPDTTLCEGLSITLQATGALTFIWNNNVQQNVAFTPTVSGSYTVIGTDNFNCTNSDVINITIIPIPSATISGGGAVCQNENLPGITFSGQNSQPPYIFGYQVNGGPTQQITSTISSDTTIFISPSSPGTYNFSLINVSTQGNSSCSQSLSGNSTVVIYPLPLVYAGNDLAVCETESITLTASGADSYTWDNSISNGVSFTANATQTYTVTGTSTNGCTNTDQVIISVKPIPNVIFSIPDYSPCVPLTVTPQYSPANNLICVWTINNQSVQSCDAPTISLTEPGCVDISLTLTDQGCSNTLSLNQAVCGEEPPIADFESNPYSITELNPIIHLINESLNADSYVWSFGDGLTSSITNPTHSYSVTGQDEFLVCLEAISANGCEDTLCKIITVNEDLIFYVPNSFTPDDDEFNQVFKPIFTSGYDPKDFVMLIFNRWGETLFETHDPSIGWDGTFSGNSLVQDGVYTWKIIFKSLTSDKKKEVVGHVNVLR